MKARFDGLCVKCGRAIKGFTNHPLDADEIAWTRKPRPDGLQRAAWHIACDGKVDNPYTVSLLRARQDKRAGDIPYPSEHPSTHDPVQYTESKAMPDNGDFLSSMATALVPHLTGRLTANVDGLTAKIDSALSGIEPRLQAMIDNAVHTIVVENRATGDKVDIGRQHESFEKLLKLVTSGMDVYLYGEPGTGKSTAGEYVAKALNLPFGYVALTIQTSESRLIGYNDANGEYVATEFYKRYTEGGIFLIDEIDNASGNLLTALNSALANGNGAFPCGQVKRHPDFICIATGNTTGFGHNPMFPERQVLSGAIRDRFVFLNWTYDTGFERELSLAQHDDKARTIKWVAWVQATRTYCAQYDPKLPVTPRASIKGARLLDEFSPEECAHMLVFRGYDKDSVIRILKNNPLPKF
jgi:cobaltochelatase CobS